MNAPYSSMARNNAWANETLYAAIQTLEEGALTAPAPGFFGSLAATMNHILLVDRYYIAALEGASVPYAQIDAPDITDAVTLAKAQAAMDARLIAICDGLGAQTLNEMRTTQRDGGPVPERVDALLLHLIQHQVHHRGQAHVQLQTLGIAPPQLDDFHLTYGRVPSAARWQD
ncbi:nuclease (plasmid) [Pseudohalocynthiibacter aestuariivivens]|nr:DinB family protein [Pseudohalocynthiibacter aestuariivivens]QIE48255.1 nuclease [Pseudohalocynthiibacter aestuariivivens]